MSVPSLAGATPAWYSLDGSPPGTRPTIVELTGSTYQQTILEVTLHGFYYEDVIQQGNLFRRVFFTHQDGDAPYRVVGRPELPPIVHTLGLPVGTTIGAPVVTPLEETQLGGFDIYPLQPPTIEGDPQPSFVWDQAFYAGSTESYPNVRGESIGSLGRWNGLRMGGARSYPFRVVPAARIVTVTKKYRLTIPHPGTLVPQPQTHTLRQGRMFESLLQNFSTLAPLLPFEVTSYAGDFLFILPWWADEETIRPLADQKRARGYSVQIVRIEEPVGMPEQIQAIIADWWAAGSPGRDHYCILCSYNYNLGTATDENGNPSDKVYACVDGTMPDGRADPFPEVRLGRIPAMDEDDLDAMIRSAILVYEQDLTSDDTWLNRALLVAHQEEDPGRYMQAQQDVVDQTYALPPVFDLQFGGLGATDQDVIDSINDGKGIVSYRGHGSTTAWAEWNTQADDFELEDLYSVGRGPRVVFSITCDTADLPEVGSFAEHWVRHERDAVAFYGATRNSDTQANSLLNRELFWLLFNEEAVILGDLLALAESWTIAAYPADGEENTWMYLLLGDPEMEVWRMAPIPLWIAGYADVIQTGAQSIYVHVDAGSALSPIAEATVALWKDGEFSQNRYTDANGDAVIPIDPQEPGVIRVTAYTQFGTSGVVQDSIIVVSSPTSVAGEPGRRLHLSAVRPNPSTGRLAIDYEIDRGERVLLDLFDAAGRRVAILSEGPQTAGAHRLEWNGRGRGNRPVPAGVYVLRLKAGGSERRSRVVIAK